MTQAFWEVLKDLWHFIFSSSKKDKDQTTPNKKVPQSDSSLAGVIIPSTEAGQDLGRVAYVQDVEVGCFTHKDPSFDNQVGILSYGEKLIITRVDGIYAEVRTPLIHGWVEIKALSDDPNKVFPVLQTTNVYDNKSEQAVKIRQLLQDETHVQRLNLPLQSTEYVLYVLKRGGLQVPWPAGQPKEPGMWHNTLRDVKGVSMDVEPRTAAILEYVGNGTPGFLGYVAAVHPDQSITLQSVGRVKAGEYLVEEFTRQQWEQWHPVFISFA